jgi:hypothetical protein
LSILPISIICLCPSLCSFMDISIIYEKAGTGTLVISSATTATIITCSLYIVFILYVLFYCCYCCFLNSFTPKTSCLSESWLWCIMQPQPGTQGHAGA